jgi:hypothetical protein
MRLVIWYIIFIKWAEIFVEAFANSSITCLQTQIKKTWGKKINLNFKNNHPQWKMWVLILLMGFLNHRVFIFIFEIFYFLFSWWVKQMLKFVPCKNPLQIPKRLIIFSGSKYRIGKLGFWVQTLETELNFNRLLLSEYFYTTWAQPKNIWSSDPQITFANFFVKYLCVVVNCVDYPLFGNPELLP